MPHLETEPLIKLYYEQVKEKYPLIDIDSFILICKSPFRFIKSQMERLDMPIIFIKYFGKWTVKSSNLHNKLSRLDRSFKNKEVNTLTEEEYISLRHLYQTKHDQLVLEEEESKKSDMRSAKNRREVKKIGQILEIIDDTEN